jgi:hypothetical protein
VIAPNRSALTTQQWIQLGHARSGHAPLTEDAATALYHLIVLHSSPIATTQRRRSASPSVWSTDEWNAADEGLQQLGDQSFLDPSGTHLSPSQEVRYSLGLTD